MRSEISDSSRGLESDFSVSQDDDQSIVSEHSSEMSSNSSYEFSQSAKRNIDSIGSSGIHTLTKKFLKRQNVITDSHMLNEAQSSLVNSFSKALARNIHNTIESVEIHI